MMPSVAVHGGTRRHPRDPAIRLSAAGLERASLPFSLSPRLDRRDQDSNALFASQSQSFLQGSRRFLRSGREASLVALRSAPCGQNENLTRQASGARRVQYGPLSNLKTITTAAREQIARSSAQASPAPK